MKDLVIPGKILKKIHTSPNELLIDLAVYLYDNEKMTMRQAKKLARLTQLEFQRELLKREIYIKYDEKDLETDLKTLNSLE